MVDGVMDEGVERRGRGRRGWGEIVSPGFGVVEGLNSEFKSEHKPTHTHTHTY